jgi:hypothetical protein
VDVVLIEDRQPVPEPDIIRDIPGLGAERLPALARVLPVAERPVGDAEGSINIFHDGVDGREHRSWNSRSGGLVRFIGQVQVTTTWNARRSWIDDEAGSTAQDVADHLKPNGVMESR